MSPGIGFEKACRLSNTIHSEIAPSLSLPSLPVSTGAADPALGLFEDAPGRGFGDDWSVVLPQVEKIASLLRDCDVGYLHLNKGAKNSRWNTMDVSNLYNEVLKQYPEAFDCSTAVSQVLSNQSIINMEHLKISPLLKIYPLLVLGIW
ncbi:hypothetical protein KSP39_PZI009262 [Platanthera zijinensis]|uniref:Uncharacterized protein n=1 Tax=Platanthera zijinensis TaxID=2320716 RepID=A0AAP0BKG1_9ASPA